MLSAVVKRGGMAGGASPSPSCIFCQIARSSTTTTTTTPLLHSDDKVVAFQDINPSALRHYLVISVGHIPTVKDLQRKPEDFSLVSHMLNVGQTLLHRDAPHSKEYRVTVHLVRSRGWPDGWGTPLQASCLGLRFGFHQPPWNSVDHLHLHCLALPFIPRWKHVKYLSLGPLGGFIEAEKLLERVKPVSSIPSEV